MNDFYEQQDDLTAIKILFYNDYIKTYMIKLLMGFKKCFIADLFCGPGKNGEDDGSPIVLINAANYVLKTPSLKNATMSVLFNDIKTEYIDNLRDVLKNIEIDNRINILELSNKRFEDCFKDIIKNYRHVDIPKFFFLDPFTYSVIKIHHLRSLMNLKNTEILLFLSVFLSYRFSNANFNNHHKISIFLKEFTKHGVSDYSNIDAFIESIKEKLKKELNLKYVRPILLDAGARKNALFLLTKKKVRMLEINKIALKKSESGKGIMVYKCGWQSLFGTKENETYRSFRLKLENLIRDKTCICSEDIIDFAIQEGFLPKHALEILKDLKSNDKIKLFDSSGNPTKQFFIAEKPKGKTIYKYIN